MTKNKFLTISIAHLALSQIIIPSDTIHEQLHSSSGTETQSIIKPNVCNKRKRESDIIPDLTIDDPIYIYRQIFYNINNTEKNYTFRMERNSECIINRILITMRHNNKLSNVLQSAVHQAQLIGKNFITIDNIIEAEQIVTCGDIIKIKPKEDVLYNRAIHEAGHAVAQAVLNITKNSPYKIQFISIVSHTQADGSNKYLATDIKRLTCTDKLYKITTALAGSIAQQIQNRQIPELDFSSSANKQKINFGIQAFENLMYKNYPGFKSDRKYAIVNAIDIINKICHEKIEYTECAHERFHSDTKIHNQIVPILFRAFTKAYLILTQHENELEKATHALIQKTIISGDDFYDITGFNNPLFDFEEGPLPQKSSGNYTRRFINNTYEMNQYEDAQEKQDAAYIQIKEILLAQH